MILFGLPRGIKIIDSEVIDDINIPCLTGFYSAIYTANELLVSC
jgi:hypothetical protein